MTEGEQIVTAGEDASTPRVRPRLRRSDTRIELNLTTMIDVTFLLLVYFMVATDFRVGEELYRMDLPDQGSSRQAADPFDLDEEPLRITVSTVDARPDLYRIRIDGPYEQPATFEGLYEFLSERRIGADSVGGLFEPDHPMIVQPLPLTRWDHAVETFNAAARARYTNITFGVGG